MTNVLLLPKFGPQTAFAVVNNADWLDSIMFTAPGQPGASFELLCQINSGQSVVTVTDSNQANVDLLIPGLPVQVAPGIPQGCYVGGISSTNQFVLVNAGGTPVNATITDHLANLTFQPLPMDISGITFEANMRSEVGDAQVYLALTTLGTNFVNGGIIGTLSFNVPHTVMQRLRPGSYVLDIVAIADGVTINLFPDGPASVLVKQGVT
jgi:hypothetical protein